MGSSASMLLAPGEALGLPFPASAWPALLLCCTGGLRSIILAFGVGYGLCMVTGGALTFTKAPASAWANCACGLYAAYGLRLATFLVRRQTDAAYNNSAHGRELNAKMQKTPLPVNCAVTVFVSLTQLATVYALQPLAFAKKLSALGWAGLAVGWLGLALEHVADEQKLAWKRAHPNEPIVTGLYSIVKHPNYLGEVLFWAGVAAAAQAALPSSASLLERFGGGFGPLLMIWVMKGAAGGLDKKGAEKYKDDAQHKAYADKTGSLFPKLF